MKKITYILAAAALLLLPSCRFIHISDKAAEEFENSFTLGGKSAERIKASDNYITRNETTGEFHSLKSNLPGKIDYTPGDCAVTIYGPDNVLDHITVTNENGVLEIKSNLYRITNLKKLISVKVSSPVIEQLSFNGAVDFNAPDGITALNFSATLNGAGDINISGLQANEAVLTVNGAADATIKGLDCDYLQVAINGAGDATLAGKAGNANLTISGAGDIDAEKLECPDVSTNVRGVGSIKKPKN